MAHFAQLDDSDTVIQVIVVHNNELDDNGVESEAKGIAFCQSLFGGTWVQTSYNARIRKHYASIGFVYDRARDAFVPPQPYNSWTLEEDSCTWQPPVPMPSDGVFYLWDETTLAWVKTALQPAVT